MNCRAWALSAVMATGCAMYRAPLLAPGQRPVAGGRVQRVGCLELGGQLFNGYAGSWERGVVGIVAGNACRAPVRVDFGRMRVAGRYDTGAEIAMAVHDPRAEIRVATLDGRAEVRLYFEVGPGERVPDGARPRVVCLDVGQVNVDAPAREVRELCVAEGDAPIMEAP